MNKQNHTVTMPMQDYEELMQIKKEHSYMQIAIAAALDVLDEYSVEIGNIRNILENAKQPF